MRDFAKVWRQWKWRRVSKTETWDADEAVINPVNRDLALKKAKSLGKTESVDDDDAGDSFSLLQNQSEREPVGREIHTWILLQNQNENRGWEAAELQSSWLDCSAKTDSDCSFSTSLVFKTKIHGIAFASFKPSSIIAIQLFLDFSEEQVMRVSF